MCRQYKDILTELLDKRLSPGRGQVDSCVRRNVLTFFLSEVFSQAWPESIITQVKGSLVLNLWLLSSQKEFYLQLPQKPSWYTLIFWYIIVWRRTSTKVKEFFFLQMYFNIQLLYQRGLPWQSSGYNSPLPLQGAQVQSLVREPRSRILLLLSRFSRVRLCVTPETAAHWAPLSLRFSRQEHWSGLPFPSRMHESEKWKWSHSSPTLSDLHGLQPTRLLHPWDFSGKSTGVGCHCLLWRSRIRWCQKKINK